MTAGFVKGVFADTPPAAFRPRRGDRQYGGLRGLEGSVSHQWPCAQGRGRYCSDNRLTHHGDDSNAERKVAIAAERGRQVPASLGVHFGHVTVSLINLRSPRSIEEPFPPFRRALMCRR